MESDDESDYEPGALVNAPDSEDESDEIPCARISTRKRKAANYVNEKTDDFFDNCSGYTSFGRTRKGGDRRPRAENKPVSACCLHCKINKCAT